MKILKGFSRDYWLYWTATAFDEGASNILQYLLSLYVLELTGSGTLFAAMLSVIVVPRLVLGPVAGVTADRQSRIRLMSGVLFAESALLGAYMLLGLKYPLSAALVCVLVVLMECVEIFYNASASAFLPELVPPEKLKDAISVSKVDDGVAVFQWGR